MEFIFNNWQMFIAVAAIAFTVGYAIKVFADMPTNSQIQKVEEWLLYAVTEAEKSFGGGTGQIKLRYVYDMFIAKFPYLVKAISFEDFSSLVDKSLAKFENMLKSNVSLKAYVKGE